MNKSQIYLETSVISYLVSRPSGDIKVASHQLATREWWERRASSFELYISDIVLEEASEGDPEYSQKRLEAVSDITILGMTDEALNLAQMLVKSVLPQKAYKDALHIAIACLGGVDFVLTWNFKHIANASMSYDIIEICNEAGYDCPILCSPLQLLDIR